MSKRKDALRPGVAPLLGELAGASSTDYITAGREGEGLREPEIPGKRTLAYIEAKKVPLAIMTGGTNVNEEWG